MCKGKSVTPIFGKMDEGTDEIASLLYLIFLDKIVDGSPDDYQMARSLFANPVVFYQTILKHDKKNRHDIIKRAHIRYNDDDSISVKDKMVSLINRATRLKDQESQGQEDSGTSKISESNSDF